MNLPIENLEKDNYQQRLTDQDLIQFCNNNFQMNNRILNNTNL